MRQVIRTARISLEHLLAADRRGENRRDMLGVEQVDDALWSARLLDAIDRPDPYCPVVRGEPRPLKVRMAASRELPKLESACTTIVTAR